MIRRGGSAIAAVTYILLAGLQRGVSLLILPLITHAMRPEEYGAASVLASASLLLTAVVATPLTQLIIRAASNGVRDDPPLLKAAGYYCYWGVPLFSALIALCVSLFVPEAFGVKGFVWGIEILATGFQPAAGTYALWVLQARNQLRRFAQLSMVSICLTAVSKIVFIVVLKQGVVGWAISDLVSAFSTAILAMILVRLPKARTEMSHFRQALYFTLPLIPHTASMWAVAFLSRPTLATVSTLEQVGLFSFGLSLASAAILILVESNRAALSHFARELFPAPSNETLGIVRWQMLGAFIVPAAIGCGVALTGRWIISEEYWNAFPLTGILLIGQVGYGLYIIPMNYLTQTAGLPRYSSLASGLGALIAFALVAGWGHRWGAEGAAYAMVISYLMMAGVAMALTRLCKLRIAWSSWSIYWPELLLSGASLACSVAALSAPVGSPGASAFAGVSLSLILAVLFGARLRRSP